MGGGGGEYRDMSWNYGVLYCIMLWFGVLCVVVLCDVVVYCWSV